MTTYKEKRHKRKEHRHHIKLTQIIRRFSRKTVDLFKLPRYFQVPENRQFFHERDKYNSV